MLRVDVDEAAEISQKCGISCMPTFHVYKSGEKVFEFSGNSEEKLKQMIADHKA